MVRHVRAGLRAFLDGGGPPVLLSLGTMEHLAPTRARELLSASAREAKVRAVIQSKRGAPEGQDRKLYFLPWASHDRLLPRVSAVVGHGGAGTSHAVLRAGLPAVILPFIFEQSMWGRQVSGEGGGEEGAHCASGVGWAAVQSIRGGRLPEGHAPAAPCG
jgi:sterol 3beta-glucosyltransferase